MRDARVEDAVHDDHEVAVGWVVRPQAEDTTRMQGVGETPEPGRFVERRVAGVQVVPRRVVDVHEDRVPTVGRVRAEAGHRLRPSRRSLPARAGSGDPA